jgi:lysophospholipase L1-like esterase
LPPERKYVAFVADPDRPSNWLMRPNQAKSLSDGDFAFSTDAEGWRTRDRPLPYEPRYRVLVLGDSCTFGWGVSDSQSSERALEALLSDLRVEVINRGIPGYSAAQGLHLLRDHLRDEYPQVAIVNYGWNDASESWGTDGQRLSASHAPALRSVLHRSVFYQFLTYQLLPLVPSRRRIRVSPEQYREALVSLARQLQARGAKVLLATKPYNSKINNALLLNPRFAENGRKMKRWRGKLSRIEQYNRVVERAAQETGVAFVDLAALVRVRNPNEVFKGAVHPTANGHRLLGQLLAPRIRELLIERP